MEGARLGEAEGLIVGNLLGKSVRDSDGPAVPIDTTEGTLGMPEGA